MLADLRATTDDIATWAGEDGNGVCKQQQQVPAGSGRPAGARASSLSSKYQ